VKGRSESARRRSILHVDLSPLFIAVERSLDPSLRGAPLVVGGDAGSEGIVAAASEEARAHGVRVGQPLSQARRLCPDAAFRPGDLEAYARISEEITHILLSGSRRVERPSADEAFVDLSGVENPVAAAEAIKDGLQRRLGLDAALGLGASRTVARVASAAARPRGLLVVLPGYEPSFLSGQPIDQLTDLTAQQAAALRRLGIETLGQLARAELPVLAGAVGRAAAQRLIAEAGGATEESPIEVAAPPSSIHEDHTVRDRHLTRVDMGQLVGDLAARAVRRLRPFDLAAQSLTVEVRRAQGVERRHIQLQPPISADGPARDVARTLGLELLRSARGVRLLRVRLGQLRELHGQATLFPEHPPRVAG
jgi:DNA polymerase-4